MSEQDNATTPQGNAVSAAPEATTPQGNAGDAAPEATTPQGDAGSAAPEATTPQGDAGDAAPESGPAESYTLSAPEGVALAEEALAAFSWFAREQGMSKEAAQALLDRLAPAMQNRQKQLIEQTRADWREQVKADKEIGGDRMNENLAVAKKALARFGSPELVAMLNETGLGDHPDLVRTFYRVGKAISEDGFLPGDTSAPASAKDPRRLYSASNMNP